MPMPPAISTELSPDLVHLFLQESAVQELDNPSVADAAVALRTKNAVYKRITLRLIPFIFVCYLFNNRRGPGHIGCTDT